MRKYVSFVVVSTVVAVISGGACGHGGNPTSPSSSVSSGGASGSGTSGATISGVVTGAVTTVSVTSGMNALSSSGGLSTATLAAPAPLAAGLSVSVNAAGQFVLSGVPTGDIQVQFTGPGSDARLPIAGVASGEQIRIDVRVNGHTAELENTQRETVDHRAEIEGRVTQVNVPGRTLTIGTTVVSVPTGTPITNHAGASIDLAGILVGDKVEARGAMNGSTFVASSVKLETDHTGSNTGGGSGTGATTVELSGTVTARSGTCPTISFMLGTTSVMTTRDTIFEDGACSKVVNNAKAEVRGTRGSTGVVTATRVELDGDEDDDDDHEVELNGVLTGKSGACPSITFKVGTVTVGTTASTAFKNVTCATLGNNDQVEVEGARRADGGVAAKNVEKKK